MNNLGARVLAGKIAFVLTGRRREVHQSTGVPVLAGKIMLEEVEVNAAWHCNIRCRWCSHGSPAISSTIADEKVVGRDLRMLAEWMHTDNARVLGGEPLLHPRFPELLTEIKGAGVADRIQIVTNGLLLHKLPSEAWQLADEIQISAYPNTVRSIEARIPTFLDMAASAGTSIVVNYTDYFRIPFRTPDHDDSLTQRIYRTCQIANYWRCITVEKGYLYRCPQSAFFQTFKNSHSNAPDIIQERLDIARIGSAEEIRMWLLQPSALSSCRSCAGSVGMRQLHQQIGPNEQPSISPPANSLMTTEDDVIDRDYLASLEIDRTIENGCVSRVWRSHQAA